MTLDETRLMEGVQARARLLFEDGYRARWRMQGALEVRSPKGAAYRVDPAASTCDCPFFQKHAGRHSCKHALGWKRLLSRQRACRRHVAFLLLRAWADLDDAAEYNDTVVYNNAPVASDAAAPEPEASHVPA